MGLLVSCIFSGLTGMFTAMMGISIKDPVYYLINIPLCLLYVTCFTKLFDKESE